MSHDNEYIISISKEEMSGLPRTTFQHRIILVDTPEKADEAFNVLEGCEIVGFDTETRPAFQKGKVNKTALMQISTDSECYLIRINKLGIFPRLKNFLENSAVKKVGLSLRDDFLVLNRSGEYMPEGFIDLQKIMPAYGISDLSLQKIYAILFGEYITKHQRLTNWEAAELTEPQQRYAAMDAYACLQIYKQLQAKGFSREECPYKKPVPESRKFDNSIEDTHHNHAI